MTNARVPSKSSSADLPGVPDPRGAARATVSPSGWSLSRDGRRNMPGRYSFKLPELPGGMRPLRGKDATSDE
ncbi:hypothetical protein [Streptomyces griseoluteus]